MQSSDKLQSKCYTIIFLNKLKIDENTNKNNQNKTSMAITFMAFQRFTGPFFDLRGPNRYTDRTPSHSAYLCVKNTE